jgi:hypothetical protein
MPLKDQLQRKSIARTRSCAYPVLALPAAVELAKKLFDNFGAGPHSRESAARGLGYSSFSGAVSAKIGALVHFGLLSRLSGRYSFTPLASAVFSYPLPEGAGAIAAAAKNPVLYQKLIARFSGEFLPRELEQILAADYGITQKAAAPAAENFLETMEFAGAMKEGMLVFPESGKIAESRPIPESGPSKKNNNGPETDNGTIKIKLPSGIEIIFPQSLAYRVAKGEFAKSIDGLDGTAGNVG